MNKDILVTISNNLTKVFAGPLLLIFIPMYLTSTEQGYWYTFTSIAALSVFADLGFSTIVLQFAAHEFAYCKFDDKKELRGDSYHIWKLASFFRFTVKWLTRVISIVFPIIIIGGYLFLQQKQEGISWQLPWLIYSFASAIVFFNSALLSFFEGCDSVAVTQKCRMYITAITALTTLVVLYFGLGLYALAVSLVFSAIVGTTLIYKHFGKFAQYLWSKTKEKYYQWQKEFNALIWRYAVSWCSGYFIFQLFTPLAFQYHGAVFAGKIGISIAMWTAGFNIANSWLTAVTPKLNMLVSEKKWQQLDTIFNKSLVYSILTMLVGGCCFFMQWHFLAAKVWIFQRILSWQSMLLLFSSWLCQIYINGLALYLRSHKKEPMMPISLFSAFYVSITTLLCALYLEADYLFLGFLSSYIYGVPVTYYLYKKQKLEHQTNQNLGR